MRDKIRAIANSVIGEFSLPYFFVFAKLLTEYVRVSTLNELHCAFQSYICNRCEQQMHMLRHQHKGMQLALTPVVIHRFQKQPGIGFNDEKPTSLPG